MLNELTRAKAEILKNAGKPKENGVLSARERIAALLDAGSFIELYAFEGLKDNTQAVITGYGTVEDRVVYVYATDGASGGVLTEENAKKIVKCMDMALLTGAPCVGLFDATAIPLADGMAALSAFGEIFKKSAQCKGVIPQLVAVLGTVAGGAAYAPAMADFAVMTKRTGKILTQGVQTVDGMTTGTDFGSVSCHGEKTGICSVTADDDAECMAKIRTLLSLLPSNNVDGAAAVVCTDDLNRLVTQLSEGGASSRRVLEAMLDKDSMFEVYADFAKDMVTALGRMNGRTVCAICSSGTLCARKCKKAAHLVKFADSFNIPIVTLVDTEGYKEGSLDVIKEAADLYMAYARAKTAKVTVITGAAYSSASLALGSRAAGADIVLAFANARIAAAEPKVGANILYSEQIAKSKDPVRERENVTKQYIQNDASVFKAAASGAIDDVIDPAEVRPRVVSALEMLLSKKR